TIHILPEDVVQSSIQQFQFGTNQIVGTNRIAVRWTYTEAGAKKMLAFREAHQGQKVCTEVGSFKSQPGEIIFRPMPPTFTNYAQWKEGWLQHRTDKFFALSRKDADMVLTGLKGK